MSPFHAIRRNAGLRRVVIVNALYSFISAALAVLVPLYLIDQQVDLAQIGLLLAIAPLTFMILRINFASLADELGTKVIGISYSIINLLSIALYVVSNSILAIALAIFGESIRASAFWAIIRTEIIYESENPKAMLAFLSGVRQLADAFGRLFIGFVLVFLAFQNSFLFLGALSLILLYLTMGSKHETKKPLESVNYHQDVLKKIFKPHPATFWQASLLLGLASLPANMLLAFLIPIYAKAGLGLDYGQVGSLVAIFSFVDAAAVLLFMRWKINVNILLFFTILSIPALFTFPFFGSLIVIPVVISAIGTGCSGILYEYILLDQIYRSKNVSTDIGVLNIPLKIIEVLFLSTSGFVIDQFGYQPLFVILAVATLLFVVFARAFIKRSN
ncbi:Major Facilitator Superfamily protein [Candidatus Bilamarchaeum dharawalense]|uniref:Major Facilitator Superfamily protein n=1 Tax=Candidatus Bilamarchaeum dharawalense TaxID=2885759 RepID=A0A5E4LNT2_9ARCH|nr:Major Facilitator Superfamily protein [Candidatus Bilamarchaeum dharawalense]